MQAILKKFTTIKTLGTLLILCSIAGFFFLLSPIFSAYFASQPALPQTLPAGTYVTIPKIGAQAQVIVDVNPWNEVEYMEALKKGVAHAKGTSLPGMPGTSFLFAHSSGNPLEMNRNNTVFLRLGELVKGDEIVILHNGRRLRYRVRESKEVWPQETRYLTETKNDQLILQTCTPIGTNLKRLLVFADPT